MKSLLHVAVVAGAVASFAAGCHDLGSVLPVAPPDTPPVLSNPVTYQARVKPILLRSGCIGCHGGSGGLFVGSVAQLLAGGDHGPAVVPGNADASHIIQKLSPAPPFGARMPFGSPPLPDTTIQVIKDWINQGALDN